MLIWQKRMGKDPRCGAVTNKIAAENFQRLQLRKSENKWVGHRYYPLKERTSRKTVGSTQKNQRSYESSTGAPRGTWIKPQGKLEVPQGVAIAKGGLAINYRREFKSEKQTHVSENYLGKNPMTRTQWRRFQRR